MEIRNITPRQFSQCKNRGKYHADAAITVLLKNIYEIYNYLQIGLEQPESRPVEMSNSSH